MEEKRRHMSTRAIWLFKYENLPSFLEKAFLPSTRLSSD
jgi:hypothetical protein